MLEGSVLACSPTISSIGGVVEVGVDRKVSRETWCVLNGRGFGRGQLMAGVGNAHDAGSRFVPSWESPEKSEIRVRVKCMTV